MKILWITSSYPRFAGDGAGSFIASLARALVALGHTMHVIAPYDPAVEEMDQGGVFVHRFHYAPSKALHLAGHGRALHADRQLKWVVPCLMPVFALAASAMALWLQHLERFDVIHGHWAVPSGPIASLVARLTGRPLIVSMHGSDVYVIERSAIYAVAARYGFRRAARVTACSEDLQTRAIAVGLEAGKSQLLPYGVDVQRYGAGQGATARDRLGIPPAVPVIGALGRLVHKKGFDVLLEALPRVLAAYPKAYCVIGGQGDLKGQLSSQAQALGIAARVLFPGHIGWQETPDYYAMCDIVTVPSIIDAQGNVDGLPNVLLEALASGCAVVGSDVAGIPSVIEHDRNGLLCPPGDKGALEEALLCLLADRAARERLGHRARQDMAAAYDWPIIAARLSTIYEQALGKAV